MKHPFIKLIIFSVLIILVYGCSYEDFREDYAYSTVYFSRQIVNRNFVEGEINTIKIGVVLGGKRVNTVDEWVRFTTEDTTGISTTAYEILPKKYFTLSDYDEFIVQEGKMTGEISMEIDPAFYEDSLAHKNHYALIFKLQDASTDSLLSAKDSLLLIIGFKSRYFGNYYHNGRVIRRNPSDNSIIDSISYHQEIPVTNKVNLWSLNTVGSKTVYSNGIANYAPSDLTGFYIHVDDSYSLQISEDSALISKGYNWELKQGEGENYYDPDARKFYLSYKFTDITSGYECFATDTLIFRNRILDGVNQWDF